LLGLRVCFCIRPGAAVDVIGIVGLGGSDGVPEVVGTDCVSAVELAGT
jgi:hypothetical protein